MKSAPQFQICPNPECPESLFIPTRSNQIHCCNRCKNRANYIKRKELLANRYADVNQFVLYDRVLEDLFKGNTDESLICSVQELNLRGIPTDIAIKISRNESTGARVHFFSNFGIESADGRTFRIFKRLRNER